MADRRNLGPQAGSPPLSPQEEARRKLEACYQLLAKRTEDGGRRNLKDALFDKQLTVSGATRTTICLLAGRRAGKSFYAAYWLMEGCLEKPGSLNLFVTITRDNARLIVWPELKKLNNIAGLGFQFNETMLEAHHPNGSRIVLRGCKDRPSVERFRGPKYYRVFIDECGSFPPYLKNLYHEAIKPGTFDQRGKIIFAGTPGIAWNGFWFQLTGPLDDPRTNHFFPIYSWTMLDNPHIPDVEEQMEEVLRENGWTRDHPTFRREYLGEWVEDESDLVFPFSVDRNAVDTLPVRDPLTHERYKWTYVLGIDYGYVDATGFVLDAYCEHLEAVYTVRSWKKDELISGDLAHEIRTVESELGQKVFVVMDYGAAKGISKEIEKRYGIKIYPAEKRDRSANLRLLRSEVLAEGRRYICVANGANDALLDEWAVLRWDDEHKDVRDGQEDHCSDAKMYSDRFTRHYQYEPIEVEPEYGSLAWQKAERDRIIAERRKRAEQREKTPFWQR